MALTDIHSRIFTTATVYSAIVGLWALFIAVRQRKIDSNFWGTLIINELIFVAQAIIGLILVFQGRMPARDVHYLYGILGVIIIPSAFAFTRGRDTHREAYIYGAICLFLAGVALRAAATAAG
ncbi:MAG: hypothetical protein FJ030_07345 [Chloroflexi bacterium]|nr:hypothetical protein [Chloroflexota bacterium]